MRIAVKKLSIMRTRGFTLIELLIVVAIVGIVSSVGLPAYLGYIDASNMSKVNAAYENAVHLVQTEFSKNGTRLTLGLGSSLPVDDSSWVELFDPTGSGTAPGGGKIYRAGTGNSSEGVVFVNWDDSAESMELLRPEYLRLVEYKATITKNSVTIDKN